MDLIKKHHELKMLILNYLENRKTLEDLQSFAWEMIDYFSEGNKDKLPTIHRFEKEFWYAIWQIQHVADQEHEKEGVTKRILSEAFEYLNGNKKIPENYIGRRP